MPASNDSQYAALAPCPDSPPEAWSTGEGLSVRRHDKRDWAAMYPHIERLYVQERRKLQDVMKYMKDSYGFEATYDHTHMLEFTIGVGIRVGLGIRIAG